MKTWIRDALIGWASATVANFVLVLIIGGHNDIAALIIFLPIIISLIPGGIGGCLGGKYIAHKWGNVIGGVVLGIAFLLIIRY